MVAVQFGHDLDLGRFGRRRAFQAVEVFGLEAGDLEVEVELEAGQLFEFDSEQVLVPLGQFGQAVVGKHEAAFAFRRQVLTWIVGTVSILRSGAARRRPWPARTVSSSSTTIGTSQPNSRMLATICWTWRSSWLRALRRLTLRSLTARCSITGAKLLARSLRLSWRVRLAHHRLVDPALVGSLGRLAVRFLDHDLLPSRVSAQTTRLGFVTSARQLGAGARCSRG